MSKLLYNLSAAVLCCVLLTGCETTTNGSVTCTLGVPGEDQRTVVSAIMKHVSSGYGKFAEVTDTTQEGKVFYIAPTCVPQITFYEITDDADIALIEKLTKEALDSSKIAQIDLLFLERQEWIGGTIRGAEKTIKEVTVKR